MPEHGEARMPSRLPESLPASGGQAPGGGVAAGATTTIMAHKLQVTTCPSLPFEIYLCCGWAGACGGKARERMQAWEKPTRGLPFPRPRDWRERAYAGAVPKANPCHGGCSGGMKKNARRIRLYVGGFARFFARPLPAFWQRAEQTPSPF